MYEVVVTTHFEDWLVGDETIGNVHMLEEAIDIFCKRCEYGFEQDYLTIDDFIDECFKNNENDELIDEFDKGFIVRILNDELEVIVDRYFKYDNKSHSLSECFEIELYYEYLTKEEISILENYGYVL